MLKKAIPAAAVLLCLATLAAAQATISEDIVSFASYGIADEEQLYASTQPGFYQNEKNAFSVNGNLGVKASVADMYEIFVRLNTKGRTGSGYVELSLPYASSNISPTTSALSFSLSLDSAYGRASVFKGLRFTAPVDLYLQAGKFQISAANIQKVTRYGLESALNMLKTANDLNIALEAVKTFDTESQKVGAGYSSASLIAVTNARFDEGIQRLYETDAAWDNGETVLGEYAPQLYIAGKLSNYVLPFGSLSAEGVYAMNAANMYSGNSYGLGLLLTPVLVPGVLSVPVGLAAAVYEKNIDTLGSTAANTDNAVTQTQFAQREISTAFRTTYRAGAAVGVKYLKEYREEAELNFGCSYTLVNHLYRNPLTLIGASVDGRYTYREKFLLGGGFLAGTLMEETWKTESDVSADFDNRYIVFTPGQNYGWEAYTGINLGTRCSIVLGVNNNKGLAMNYGIESVKDGERKFMQTGTVADARLFETFGVFVKATMKM